jgi:hypothetical protein
VPPSIPAKPRFAAALRLATVPLVVVALHSVAQISVWALAVLGIVAALLLVSGQIAIPGLPFLSRLGRADRLAAWMVVVCLAVIAYLHNTNSWSPDGAGFMRPGDVSMWKTELILGVALTVPLLNTMIRIARPRLGMIPGQQFAREFALYINFSGIALILWSGDAVLSWAMMVTLLAWIALAELTLYASE